MLLAARTASADFSPRWAAPHIQFLFVDSRFRYRFFRRRPHDRTGSSPASTPCDSLGVATTSFPGGLSPPIHARAGHTRKRAAHFRERPSAARRLPPLRLAKLWRRRGGGRR